MNLAKSLGASSSPKFVEVPPKNIQIQEEEVQDLESLTPTEKLDNVPATFYEAFNKLAHFTRNLVWDNPEIVLIGYVGEGKTTLLESLLGHKILLGSNNRPMTFQFINDTKTEEPHIIIHRDKSSVKFTEDKVVTVQDLPKALEARNIHTNEPVMIVYQHKAVLDVTFIDTPGFFGKGSDNKAREELILDLASKTDRTLLFVESSDTKWENTKTFKIAEQLDPKFSRSFFVFTRAHQVLSTLTSSRDVDLFLAGRPPTKVQMFFVTLLSSSHKKALDSPDKFKSYVEKCNKRDQLLLEQLKYETRRRDEKVFGIAAVRKYLLEFVSKKYSDSIPIFLKQIRQRKKDVEDHLANIREQIRTLDQSKLRTIAANYVANFSQMTKDILLGSMEGANPFTYGQELSEETYLLGEWWNEYGEATPIPVAKLPKADSKVYGGQQLQRLLLQFKYIVEQTSISDISEDDIRNATALSGPKNPHSLIWAISDLVQKRCQTVFLPLLQQLFERGTYIAKRIPGIVSGIMEAKHRAAHSRKEDRGSDFKISDHPQFVWYVKDLYEQFVDTTAKNCLEKCMDELQCTQMIYWDFTKKADIETLNQPKKDWKVMKVVIDKMAQEIYTEQQKRISKNVILKTYEFFIIRMAESLSNALQGISVNLKDEELAKMLSFASTIERLTWKEEKLMKEAASEDENPFMEAASFWSSRLRLDLK